MTTVRHSAPPDLGYILATLRFRWRSIVLPIVAFTILGGLAPLFLGERYISKATLLIDPPRLAGAGSDAVLTEEIETLRIVEQHALSDAVLTALAEELGGLGGLDETPEELRDRITLTTSGGPGRGAPGMPILAEISFVAPTADLALRATKQIVAFILSEQSAQRASHSGGTVAHFAAEAERLSWTLARAEERLSEFERQNQAALPDSLSFRRTQQAALRDRLMQLDMERANLDSAGKAESGGSEQLTKLRADRAALGAVLAPDNKRLITLDAQIEALTESPSGATPDTEFQIRSSALAKQQDELRSEIDALSLSIEDTPRIANQLSALQREVRMAERDFETALAKKNAAEASTRVERIDTDRYIAVLHPPALPEHSENPGQTTLAAIGAALGIFAGVVLVFARELFDTTISRPADLRASLGLDPFEVIPILAPRKMNRFSLHLPGLH